MNEIVYVILAGFLFWQFVLVRESKGATKQYAAWFTAEKVEIPKYCCPYCKTSATKFLSKSESVTLRACYTCSNNYLV